MHIKLKTIIISAIVLIALIISISYDIQRKNAFSDKLTVEFIDVENADIKSPCAELGGKSIGETLLTPTKIYVKPMLASLAMITVSYAVYLSLLSLGIGTTLSFAAALAAAIVSYFPFAFVFGALSKSDLLLLPFGRKMWGFSAE